MRQATSVFLPTATYPMFPEKLAMKGMSLKQGKLCKAVTVLVVLHYDGSIAEYTVDNSIIKPTYMLTYESATELLYLNLEEEAELKILSQAVTLRLQWRRKQGCRLVMKCKFRWKKLIQGMMFFLSRRLLKGYKDKSFHRS
ncbi:Ribonuclease [Actinidia chinensis var. chinensis]|uniref:Ribonuclease n=1 Tax=Actinidia chinensis var. chinensis TaxID=1590841 RepID=A0A2R6PX70_ACTCC|nr:Ribonuclease [Actinidia chinensis var. chinensis]